MKSKKVPEGEAFLPGIKMDKLRRLRAETKDKKGANRLLAYIMRKKGNSTQEISDANEIPYTTTQRWLVEATRRELDAVYDKPKPGRPCRLTTRQRRKLCRIVSEDPKKHGFQGGAWTARQLAVVVKEEFGVEYGERGMQLLLRRIGLI